MEIKTADKFIDTCNNLSGMIQEILLSGREIPPVIILTVNDLMCNLVNFNNHCLKTNKSFFQHNVLNNSSIGSLSHSKKDAYEEVRSSSSVPDSQLIGPKTLSETVGSPIKHVANASSPSHPSSHIDLQKDKSDDRSKDKQTEKPPLITAIVITKVFRTYLNLIVKGLFKSNEVTIYCRVCNLLCLTSWSVHEVYASHIEKASRFDDLIMCFCRLCRLCIYVRRDAIVPYFKYHYNKLHLSKSELSWNECLVFVESTNSPINSSESDSVLNKILIAEPSAVNVKNDIAPASSSESDNNKSLSLVPNISTVEKPSALKHNCPNSNYVMLPTLINSPTTNPCPKPNDSKKFNSPCSSVKTGMMSPASPSKSESLISSSPEAIRLSTTNDPTVEVQPVDNISSKKSPPKPKKRGGKKRSAKANDSAVAPSAVIPRADSSRAATESKANKKDPVQKAPVQKNLTDALPTTLVNSLYPNFDKLVNEMLDEWKETSIKLDGGYCSVCDLGILSAFDWYNHTEDHKNSDPSRYDEELCPYCNLKLFGSEHQKYFNLPCHINLDEAFGKPRKS